MIRSDRNIPVGCHVTKEIRDALRQLQAQGASMSKFIASAIEEKLKRGGEQEGEQAA